MITSTKRIEVKWAKDMKLQRESINLGSEYNGKWNFVIMDSDSDKI